jgi:hypothetical protein
MSRGRESEGEAPLSNAARQARHRARHKEKQASAIVRPLRPVGRPRLRRARLSRIQRWHAAVAELVDLQAGYAAWRAPASRLWPLTPSPTPQRLADMAIRQRCVRRRGCHLYFARRLTLLSCADRAIAYDSCQRSLTRIIRGGFAHARTMSEAGRAKRYALILIVDQLTDFMVNHWSLERP